MCEVINLLESNALELEYVSECARLMSSQIQGDFKHENDTFFIR